MINYEKMLTVEQVELVFDSLINEKNEFGEPCLLKVGIDPKTGKELYRPNIGVTGLLALLTKYESKPEFKLTLEAMLAEMVKKTKEDLDVAVIELDRREKLHLLLSVDPKTDEPVIRLNDGSFGTKIPDSLTLFYDLCAALFRLSQDREWIPYTEICNNIENIEYVEDWRIALLMLVCYAASQSILEPRGDDPINLEIRLVHNKGTNIIKQFINEFDRPDFEHFARTQIIDNSRDQ